MAKLTVEEICKRFESSKEFNEIFDAFEQAIELRVVDMDIYIRLFWNQTLSPDELCFFGEQLPKEFPELAYNVYLWLATVFEATYSMFDNHELALRYFQKAAEKRPHAPEPYLEAAECYERDLNIPPITTLIDFLRKGTEHVVPPAPLFERLIAMYEIAGNDEMTSYYRRKLNPPPPPSQDPPTAP